LKADLLIKDSTFLHRRLYNNKKYSFKTFHLLSFAGFIDRFIQEKEQWLWLRHGEELQEPKHHIFSHNSSEVFMETHNRMFQQSYLLQPAKALFSFSDST
jgi:hypothetical protein